MKYKQSMPFLYECETCYAAKCRIQTTALWTQPITSGLSGLVFTFRVAARLMSFPSCVLWLFFFFLSFRQHSLHGRWSKSCQRSDELLFAVGSLQFACSKHTKCHFRLHSMESNITPAHWSTARYTKWEVGRWFFKNDDCTGKRPMRRNYSLLLIQVISFSLALHK